MKKFFVSVAILLTVSVSAIAQKRSDRSAIPMTFPEFKGKIGKNHNTPDWKTTVAGPFDRWPTGLGFDYFYGFNAGETHQYYPVLFENTVPVEPQTTPEECYHFTTDARTDRPEVCRLL